MNSKYIITLNNNVFEGGVDENAIIEYIFCRKLKEFFIKMVHSYLIRTRTRMNRASMVKAFLPLSKKWHVFQRNRKKSLHLQNNACP